MPSFPPTLDYLPVMPASGHTPIGCIGAGFIMADCHLVAYRQAGFRPQAIASRTAARAHQVAQRHQIPKVYDDYRQLLDDPEIEVVDIAVPPDVQLSVVREVAQRADHVRGVLAQKPLGINYAQAKQIVAICQQAGLTLVVNQNMRYDQSVRGCRSLLDQGLLGSPVLATLDMRAIPHWMPWQERQGWVTLRILSVHHLDTFRYWLGDPVRVYASVVPDPRTAKKFAHQDGICLYILEYDTACRAAAWDDVWTGPAREGAAEDFRILWRLEGTDGAARGTIGWIGYPERQPSTLDWTSVHAPGGWHQPRWDEVWFPDAFAGPMAELLRAVEEGVEPQLGGLDNLRTMALVDACYRSAADHRPVAIAEITG